MPRRFATKSMWPFRSVGKRVAYVDLPEVKPPQAFFVRRKWPLESLCLEQTLFFVKRRWMDYRAEATSVEGFIQQIACCYLRHGYWFYVVGKIPAGKDPRIVDHKIIRKYGIAISESTRARRKRAGGANLQYIRHESTFVIFATKGEHRFFEQEAKLIRDIRRVPLHYAGYCISYKPGGRTKSGKKDHKWHSHVAMERKQYLELRACFTEQALRLPANELALAFYRLPIAPYAPIRRQLLTIHREVNRIRKIAGKRPVPIEALPLRRRPVKPFEPSEPPPPRLREGSSDPSIAGG